MGKRRPSGDGMVRKTPGGRWEGRIVVGHKENGNPIFRYVYANTQRELLDKLHRAIESYQDANLTQDSVLTLGEWLDRWLEEYKADTLRPNTLSGYESYTRNYIKPILGDKAISKITPADVQRMYNKLKASGRVQKDAVHGEGLADATLNRIHAMLHLALKDAQTAHIIAQNPLDQVANPKPSHKPMQVLNEEQLDAFMAEAQKDELWRDFFYTELTIGLRRGEICALKWEDFDETAGTLKIQRSVSARRAGKIMVGETKTNRGLRKIVLPATTANILRERKKTALTEWIFPNPLRPEEPMSPSRAYNHMKTLLKRAGLPSIRFHDLRHTFATHALASGVDAKTLASILGHTNASFTLDIYAHATEEMQRQAAANIDRGIGKAEPQTVERQTPDKTMTTFQACKGKRRRAGTGYLKEIRPGCWEGRYSPVWPDGKKHSRDVYGKTKEECEAKLEELITQMKAEIAAVKANQQPIPDGIRDKKKRIAVYMRQHPEITSKRRIAREVGVGKDTVRRYYEEIREEMGM